jgi:hypothetical protein
LKGFSSRMPKPMAPPMAAMPKPRETKPQRRPGRRLGSFSRVKARSSLTPSTKVTWRSIEM